MDPDKLTNSDPQNQTDGAEFKPSGQNASYSSPPNVQQAQNNNDVNNTPQNQPENLHVPEEIIQKITETPAQGSHELLKGGKKGSGITKFKSIISILVFAGIIILAAYAINQTIFQSYYVDGSSMTPTLENNDRLIISKVEHSISLVQGKVYIPERGQIVILDSSITGLNGRKEQLIKRVIGLPGDRVTIENGTVTIYNSENPNGFNVDEELGLNYLDETYSDHAIDVVVPEDSVYVLGDNRQKGGSYDSRMFGAISGEKIQGRLWARVLPIEQAQLYGVIAVTPISTKTE